MIQQTTRNAFVETAEDGPRSSVPRISHAYPADARALLVLRLHQAEPLAVLLPRRERGRRGKGALVSLGALCGGRLGLFFVVPKLHLSREELAVAAAIPFRSHFELCGVRRLECTESSPVVSGHGLAN